ncbi:hypothetical protein A2635_05330 [Candidatus Peribacteria bacterium RIFCSPHIGHO2_01_FULL_51_9]|nr:MAG: hypothetical protein A2635_05330 [Candidatus Peribacteria bacterium RIFCSPHIGHO2_01_FULL_51_9]
MSLLSPIHHTFAPHVDWQYVCRTLAIVCAPWRWQRGPAQEQLKKVIKERFHADVFLFSCGREALLAILKAIALKKKDEIILQSYTCIVVPNAIKAANGVPVFADIDEDTLNLNLDSTEAAITNLTRAILCQHTFGIPSDTNALLALCSQYDIMLIEDCAHVLPDSIEADLAFLSFGRDKAISGITGGAVIVRSPQIAEKLKKLEEHAHRLSSLHIFRLLCYPLVYFVARPLYKLGIGKFLLKCAQLLGLLVPIVSRTEKAGAMESVLHALPNACAKLALFDWTRLHEKNEHRRRLTSLYLEEAKKNGWKYPSGITQDMTLQKFPLFARGADEIRKKLKRQNIHLDDGWTGCVICPSSSNLASLNYVPGSDPKAEAASEKILSLPTHPTMTRKQAIHLIGTLAYIY